MCSCHHPARHPSIHPSQRWMQWPKTGHLHPRLHSTGLRRRLHPHSRLRSPPPPLGGCYCPYHHPHHHLSQRSHGRLHHRQLQLRIRHWRRHHHRHRHRRHPLHSMQRMHLCSRSHSDRRRYRHQPWDCSCYFPRFPHRSSFSQSYGIIRHSSEKACVLVVSLCTLLSPHRRPINARGNKYPREKPQFDCIERCGCWSQSDE
mmetsp:Transcript_10426/g.28709  ORF Transcript_10426/g.28709 Transcript_10426/m.28709 type:complete len:202 (-) Transcript_10426:35-640(-)